MTIQSFKGGFYFPDPYWGRTDARLISDSTGLTAVSQKAAYVLEAPRTGNINGFAFYVPVLNSQSSVDCRMETVDGATGLPTGTLWATGTNVHQVVNGVSGFLVSISALASINRGDPFAFVVAQPAATPGDFEIRQWTAGAERDHMIQNVYVVNYDGASWTKANRTPAIAVRYSDGNYYPILGNLPGQTVNDASFNSGFDPVELGQMFCFPSPVVIRGFFAGSNFIGITDYRATLFNAAGVTLQSVLVDGNIGSGSTNYYGNQQHYFPQDVTVTAGASIYMMLRETNGVTFNVKFINVINDTVTAQRGAWNGGDITEGAFRAAAGTFSTSAGLRFVGLGLIGSGFDDGTGGTVTTVVTTLITTLELGGSGGVGGTHFNRPFN